VLVTDDNELNLKVASGCLELYGMEVDTATRGEEALKRVQEKTYDLVFMDHMMPGMDGVETTKVIRRLGGDYEELTIVALTANSLVGSETVFLDNGLNDYMSKPIDAKRLAEVLKRWIPADKMEERPAIAEEAAEQHVGFLDKLAKIPGINVERGMLNFFQKKKIYRETLALFHGKAERDCAGMKEFLAEGNIERFAIAIHGMKASLLTFGISELSTIAQGMELEAKAGNIAYCLEHFPPFAAQVLDFNQRLAELFVPEEKPTGNGQPKEGAAFLLERLRQFEAAADVLDVDLGIKLLSELCGYDFNEIISEQLQSALAATRDFDYDKALERVQKVVGLCE
jgi:CheY-like chemotaxis protein/HPt (histidine-containing phosphotransfer) domain-containing protein